MDQEAQSRPARAASPGPIVDTHIHLYQVTRPGGVVWPEPRATSLYRDVLPADYKREAATHGIIGTGVVEASPIFEDNFQVLERTRDDPFFRFLVAQLQIASATFSADLERLAQDERVVGIRGFLWSPALTLEDAQLQSLGEVAAYGMTLDLISRGTLNPKPKVAELAAALPNLRIILDHLAGARGRVPDPEWVKAMQRLAGYPNVFVKLSSYFDMFNPSSNEDEPWVSPSELSAYDPHFDVLMQAFGEDRLIWGSNWPVVELGGGLGASIAVAEAYLAGYGPSVRDKVMCHNAEGFYRRLPR